MTNDKELIAKITREYCAEQKIPTVLLAVEVCTEVIARYLAERGGEAVAYRHTSAMVGSCLNTLPDQLDGWVTEPLFLAPQPSAIPEGIALVPKKLTDDMQLAMAKYVSGGDFYAAYNALIAAAGVKP